MEKLFDRAPGEVGESMLWHAEKNTELGEIRSIKVPALNLEAFWLHCDGEEMDMIVSGTVQIYR